MTPTAEDATYVLAALDAGWIPVASYPREFYRVYNAIIDDVYMDEHPTPEAALAAIGRALELQPKWVVVPVEVAEEMAPNLRTLADLFDQYSTGENTGDYVQKDLRALANALSSTPPKDGDTT